MGDIHLITIVLNFAGGNVVEFELASAPKIILAHSGEVFILASQTANGTPDAIAQYDQVESVVRVVLPSRENRA